MATYRRPLKDKDGNTIIPALADVVYPIGSIYLSATLSTPAQVANVLGGTWEAWGSGRIPIGVNSSDTDFNAPDKTGGTKTHSHDLSGTGYAKISMRGTGAIYYREKSVTSWTSNYVNYANSGSSSSTSEPYGADLGGTTSTTSSLQPYITCYMYRRTA